MVPRCPACHQRPTFRDPPWVDTERFCAELVYQSAHNEALALAALAVAPDGTLYAASPLRGEVWALRDSDGDRLPDDAQLAVTGLTLPSGLDWGGDALYITGGPNIWRLPAGAQGAETLVTRPAAPARPVGRRSRRRRGRRALCVADRPLCGLRPGRRALDSGHGAGRQPAPRARPRPAPADRPRPARRRAMGHRQRPARQATAGRRARRTQPRSRQARILAGPGASARSACRPCLAR